MEIMSAFLNKLSFKDMDKMVMAIMFDENGDAEECFEYIWRL